MVWDVMQNAARHPHILRHRPVYTIAKALAGAVEVVEAAAGHRIVFGNDRRRLGDDAVTFFPAFHVLADLNDLPAKLMPEHHRVIHRPGVIRGPLVQIRAANADIGDFEEHILSTDGGLFDLTDFDGAFFRREVDDGGGFHGLEKI
jgi:hypothetical protein